MSANMLKLIALIFMVIDHIGYFFPQIQGMIFMRMIGRLAMPIYYYLLVESFIYTKDVHKFKNRILIFGTVMACGSFLFKLSPILPNIFLSMYMGILTLQAIRNFNNNKVLSLIQISIYTIISFFTEASLYGIMMIFVFYLFRDKSVYKICLYIIFSFIICLINKNIIQMFMVFAILFMCMYNNKKGRVVGGKYFYYIFYIVHIWILKILTMII